MAVQLQPTQKTPRHIRCRNKSGTMRSQSTFFGSVAVMDSIFASESNQRRTDVSKWPVVLPVFFCELILTHARRTHPAPPSYRGVRPGVIFTNHPTLSIRYNSIIADRRLYCECHYNPWEKKYQQTTMVVSTWIQPANQPSAENRQHRTRSKSQLLT